MLHVILAAVVLLAVISGLAYLTIKTTKTAKKDVEQTPQARQQEAAVPVRQAPPRRQAALDRMREGMRQRLAQRQAAEAEQEHERDDSDAESASGSGSEDEGGRQPRRRAAGRRAARREGGGAQHHGEGDEEGEGRPASKRSAYEERRAKRDAEREAQEAAQEEEMRRAAEERARREEEEAARWMGQISLEAKGEDGDESGAAAADQLSRLEAYVRGRKTVPLEEAALELGMRSAEAVERIRSLEAAGRLTGVMDERGKYIYISLEEMAAVASFLRQRGRVAIGELAARSAQLIDLEPRQGEGAGAGGGAGGAAGLDFDQLLAAA
ncbi:hypothetical protein Agub_g12221 [Astrephomene gubernaculifera]|uniref:DDRGK domain-containing protein 1 n=1 Tax=Astrephomene gubernaculifera TaxID=47775 RepID=A0AAD3HRE9_9CHLO|nr:hypothetical protein Agub_g12221 [Astrephomene gubernaculifera]